MNRKTGIFLIISLAAAFYAADEPATASIPAGSVDFDRGGMVVEVATKPRKKRRAQRQRPVRQIAACDPRNGKPFKFQARSSEFEPADLAALHDLIRRAGPNCSYRVRAFAGDQGKGNFRRARIDNIVNRRTDALLAVFDENGVSRNRLVVQEGGNVRDEKLVGTALVMPLSANVLSCDTTKVDAAVRDSRLKFDFGSTELTADHSSKLRQIGNALVANSCAARVKLTGGANTLGRGTERFDEARQAAQARFLSVRDALVKAGVSPQQIVLDTIDIRTSNQGWRGHDGVEISIGD